MKSKVNAESIMKKIEDFAISNGRLTTKGTVALIVACLLSFSCCCCGLILAPDVEEAVNSNSVESTCGITKMSFALYQDEIELDVGRTKRSYFNVTSSKEFSIDDISFISTDESVATFTYDETALNSFIYFKIEALSPGTTTIYAQTKDGAVKTEEITVKVTGKVTTTTPTKTTATTTTVTSSVKTTTTKAQSATAKPGTTTQIKTTVTGREQIVYWTSEGTKYHTRRNCKHIKNKAVSSGTIEEAKAAGYKSLCADCAKA